MLEIAADPPFSSCYCLYPTPGIQEYQKLGPDPFLPCARDGRGSFATRTVAAFLAPRARA